MKTAALLAAAAFCLGVTDAWPDTYPTQPIRLIAPFPPGGNTDMPARTIAGPLSGERMNADIEKWRPVMKDSHIARER